MRSTRAIEVKWGVHADGEARAGWATNPSATTLSLLVRGKIRLFFDDGQQTLLADPGDYALWAPGVGHTWVVEDDNTVVLTVRWPSRSETASFWGGGRS